MSLELLISKYIDGELTQAEDAKLRSLLKENPYAKEKFDQSVDLHLDLLDDCASITVPDELLKRTEEAVMMKIFSAPVLVKNNIVKSKKIRKFNYRIPVLAATIAFLAFVSLIKISDSDYPRTIDFSMTSANEEVIEKSEANSSINIIANNIQNRQSGKSKSILSSTISDLEDNIIIEEKDIILAESDINAQDSNIEVFSTSIPSEIIDSNILSSQGKSHTSELNQSKTMLLNNIPSQNISAGQSREMVQNNLPAVNFGYTGPEITSIQLNTILSRDFTRTGIETSNNTIIRNMSQSIGYSFANNSTIGIEFGLTELTYDYTKYISLGISGEHGSSGMSVNSPSENGGIGDGNQIKVPVRLQNESQFYWGMAFYDANIVEYGDFSLSGRIGVGATNDGPLGLGRMLAKYNIMNNLAFTVGAEGRIFMMKTPLLINGISTISSYGIVYGVQLNL